MSKAEKVKKIGLFGCIANGIGAIIGAGIFGTLPEGINAIGPMVLPALIVAAIYIIANMFPQRLRLVRHPDLGQLLPLLDEASCTPSSGCG